MFFFNGQDLCLSEVMMVLCNSYWLFGNSSRL